MSDKMQELEDECLAYVKIGSNIHPSRVREMIDRAFSIGYERAIYNYCEPYASEKLHERNK